jgi:hypothetical protein
MLLRELVEGGEHLAAKFDRGFNSQRHLRLGLRAATCLIV